MESMTTSAPLLRVSNLSLLYRTPGGTLTAVDEVSFAVQAGEAVGLVGESGAGKSSLALSLVRVLPGNAVLKDGTVELEGNNVSMLREELFRREIRWQKMAMVFQGAVESLNPVVKVGQQVIEPALVHNGASKKAAEAEAHRLFDVVNLPSDVFDRYPHELSGGMKQRVSIAM